MAFDGIFLHQIVKQLQEAVNSRILKIYQISDTEILFYLKTKQKSFQLMISCHSLYNRIHFTNKKYPTRSIPSNFIVLLRKYLEGGIISSITQEGLDRYLIMEIDSHNDIGDKIHLQLYVELMGKYANLILVHNGKIVDSLKHIPPFENNIRTIHPGAKFVPTTPQTDKINPFEIDEVDTNERLSAKLVGVSDLLANEIIYRLQSQSYKQIIEEIENSNKMYLTIDKDKEYFHCIELTHLNKPSQVFEICEGLDYLYFSKEERDRIRQLTGDLFKLTKREINKFTKKINSLNADLQQAQSADQYRYKGEIIYANLDKIKKGMKDITLEDFDGEMVTIELDEKLDGKGNGKKYFTKYRKLSTGQKYIQEQIEIANENLNYFTTISQQLEMADFKTAQEIAQELEKNGYLKKKVSRERAKKPTEPNYTKITYNDKTILIGKNNIQNDFITFKKANRSDYWFHVKSTSGAHVVINSSEPNEQEIRLCATLAAYYSKFRESSSIAVDYTTIKNLKKIPNSKLGKVIMKEYKTIYIDIDEKIIESLNLK